ncbi:hypothetical protein P8452_28554 [Trifolium repens]|nr:hypothetical protein P8452_28554 [Trifolium repens]
MPLSSSSGIAASSSPTFHQSHRRRFLHLFRWRHSPFQRLSKPTAVSPSPCCQSKYLVAGTSLMSERII